jgi:hypothetical protein
VKPGNDRSTFIVIAVSCVIVAAAAVFVCLYRFTDLFAVKPTEKSIARNLDFNDPQWIDTLMELSLPSYNKDFSVHCAFSSSGATRMLTQIYASRADLGDIRSHYAALLELPVLPETNSVGVLEVSGVRNGRNVKVVNYFSEVSSLIRVDMEMSGEYADMIWQKVNAAFPSQALEDVPEIAAFAAGESTIGYVMYNYNAYATDVYADIPLFSRAYPFNGTREELEQKIAALGERYGGESVTEKGSVGIRRDDWLYQVKALGSFSGVKAALIIQAVPKNKNL